MSIFILVAVLYLTLMAVLYVVLYNVSDNWPSRAQRLLRAGLATLALGGLLGCAYLYITMYALDAPSLEQGRDRAADLVFALEEYKAAEGLYPPDLDALVPEYVAEIPRPAWRYFYAYKRCMSGERYVLAFKEAKIPEGSCAYSSYSTEWRCSNDLPPNWWELCNW